MRKKSTIDGASKSGYVKAMLTSALLVVGGCSVVPEQLDQSEMQKTAAERLRLVAADQEPITGPVDLYEAMARALKYNLDYKVEVMEQALRSKELDLQRFDMLPDLVASAGYSNRSNDYGGRSVLIEDKSEVTLNPSTSQQREHTISDLTLSWNILDFGLSYVRAKQRADDVMIAMENRRKVANRIVEDVRTAYWRAVSSERLIKELKQLDQAVESALNDSSELARRRNTSPLNALTYQRDLLGIKLQIKQLHGDFAVAKKQLAALMNVPPGQDYELAQPVEPREVRLLPVDAGPMIEKALRNRSELREIDYRLRINKREAMAALLDLLPGLNLYGGYSWDTNDLLYNDDWSAWGAEINWSLLQAFRYPSHRNKVNAEEAMLKQQALATTMAIITQVHVSLSRYQLNSDEFRENARYLDIQSKIDENLTASRKTGRSSQQEWIRERMNTIVARLKYDISYAELQNVYANVYASVGYDAFPGTLDGSESVAEMKDALIAVWSQRD